MNQSEFHESQKTYHDSSAYQKIQRLVDFEHGPKLRVLDVGSGNGKLGRELQSFGHTVIGLDIYPSATESSWVRRTDIAQDWPSDLGLFDVIICTDVAEHMVDPAHILRQAKNFLQPTGKFIFGVPNHFDIRQRLRMVMGKGIVHWDNLRHQQKAWNYVHVRFFTLPELQCLFMEQGWSVVLSQYNFMGAGIIPQQLPSAITSMLLMLWPNLFSGKFIFVLQPSDAEAGVSPQVIYIPKTPAGF